MAVTQRASRPATTRFVVEETFDLLSVLRLSLETGRTHQIRVHLSHIGHPVFGDPQYGGREKQLKGIASQLRGRARSLLKLVDRQALHAEMIGFVHPRTRQPMEFSAELPEDMKRLMSSM
jgi:23S rRNA pseudouridine1911/1915/1917 synthase